MIYLELIYEFFKIGLFAVGGGMATIPFLMDLTNKYDWYTASDLADMIAISESTPGPVGINMATYAGFQAAGVLGSVVATLALVAPAIIIITLIAKFLANFRNHPLVEGGFYGIRPAIAALIAYAVWQLLVISLGLGFGKAFQFNYINFAVMAGLLALMYIPKLKKLHPLVWIVAGAALGIILKL